MVLRILILLLWSFVGRVTLSRGQVLTVQGHVLSGPKQEPLAFAAVFLAGTTKGTLTDAKGEFAIPNVPDGQFDLIVSFLGYATVKTTIRTQPERTYRFILKPLENQLDAVTVKGHRRRTGFSNDMLALFTTNFIGQTPTAKRCRLLNPTVLDFTETDSTLTATASQPLVIENQALGYRLTYHLEQFDYNYRQQRIAYQGYPLYEALSAKDAAQAQSWKGNRQLAYRGSLMHFMRALYRRQLVKEGFAVQSLVERHNRQGERYFVGLPTDSTAQFASLEHPQKYIKLPMVSYHSILDPLRSTLETPVITFEGWLQVTYTLKKEPLAYQRSKEVPQNRFGLVLQHSFIRLLKPGLPLEASGRFDLQGMLFEGYWTWELLGDSLPSDYQPEQD